MDVVDFLFFDTNVNTFLRERRGVKVNERLLGVVGDVRVNW